MKSFKFLSCFLLFLLSNGFSASAAPADEALPNPDSYLPHPSQVKNILSMVDEHKDLMVSYPLKDVLPKEIWDVMTTDVEEAKRQTAELVGFRAPEVVGKIAPEIKPGRYTYQDLEKYPGLKELLPPECQIHIRAAGPPLIGSIPEFEIIPTMQLYWHQRLCEMTKKNLGKTKLDKDGYIVPMSWEGGCPFPRPSGEFKAQQVLYSFQKRLDSYERCVGLNAESLSFDKNFNMDKHNEFAAAFIRLMGRGLFPPYGWFDERAKKNGEFQAYNTCILEPRANRGTVVLQYMYDDPNKMDPWMIYVPSLRRIRKMSATDTQDPNGDMTYDDREHLVQKITPNKYPYKYEIIAEREYLIPIEYDMGKVYVDSKSGYAQRAVQFMRRPVYALQLTQLDPNYLYSKRVIYIDKENFMTCYSANYDQKGQLYRTQMSQYVFMSETGQIAAYGVPHFQWDHIDLHSTFQQQIQLPAVFSRGDFTMEELVKRGK